MTTAKKFGEARDASGNVVAEFIWPGRDDDALTTGLCLLTQQLIAKGHGEAGGGFFGGTYGYGVSFENGVFLMHPYCWCEQDACPWCGGCQRDYPQVPHDSACYQTRLDALKQTYGRRETWGWYVEYKGPNYVAYERDKRQLCRELGQDYEGGNEVHCDCGALDEMRRQYDSCDCEWHAGRGPFRFGAAQRAPNFWHKPSGLRVSWYKYIGRDNEVSCHDDVALRVVIEDCSGVGIC